MKKDTIFWDIDTQYDFMRPDGKLYVPGAESIIANVSAIRRFALESGYSIIASTDWHSMENPEISEQPDFKVTFPPHCMAGDSGAERVGFLGEVPVEYIETSKLDDRSLRKLVKKEQFHIVIRTDTVDLFENPNTDRLIELLRPKVAVVFGVALDVCLYNAVVGLSEYPYMQLFLLGEAVKGLNIKPDAEVYADFEKMRVQILSLDLLRGKL